VTDSGERGADSGGSVPSECAAAVVKPTLPASVEAKTFAITVEPKEGSAAPTSQPIMVGTRDSADNLFELSRLLRQYQLRCTSRY
jgi:hypothetical protein